MTSYAQPHRNPHSHAEDQGAFGPPGTGALTSGGLQRRKPWAEDPGLVQERALRARLDAIEAELRVTQLALRRALALRSRPYCPYDDEED
jgi:hypothetical protein